MSTRKFDLRDLATIIKHDIRTELHTMMPGKIVKYYPATQTADVQPMCMRVYWSDEVVDGVAPGNAIRQRLPVIGNVPVEFPGGGGFGVWFPLDAGDTCDIEFSESSWADYLATGQESPQQDVGRHKLGFALVHPVVFPSTPVTDAAITANDGMVIGQSGGQDQIKFDGTNVIIGAGATDFVALAAKTNAAIDAVVTWVLTGTGAGSSYVPPTAGTKPAAANVGTTVTKVK